jgi:uncharacterized protein YkwD
MARKLHIALAVAAVAGLVASSSAHAAEGVERNRAVTPAARAAVTSPLIAPIATCPGQTSLTAPEAAQEQTMLCLTNFARVNAGLPELAESGQLDESARLKSADVVACDEFSHFACERQFTYWMQQTGYVGEGCWHVGENLAWGTGEYGSPRSIFRAWMASPDHRRNILGDYQEVGIDLSRGELEGRPNAQVWTSHFGTHC